MGRAHRAKRRRARRGRWILILIANRRADFNFDYKIYCPCYIAPANEAELNKRDAEF
jgi:hypothetical protein